MLRQHLFLHKQTCGAAKRLGRIGHVRHESVKVQHESEYVVVGAGSAGCVLTDRLSEAGHTVTVLEAGMSDIYKWDSLKIHMPAALTFNLADDRYNWSYFSEPQAQLYNRRIPFPRGKVLGGSSSLNAMVYIRGHALDYDRWESEGARGWSYADCLPYFKKAQTHELGADEYRGGNGPLHVSRGKQPFVLNSVFIEAGVEAGYPFTDDLNGYRNEGFGPMDMTIHKGRRWSTAVAYLRPAQKRPGVKVITEALAHRILFEKGRAVGIEFSRKGQLHQIRATKEVILSGGAINTPQLLMLSGVGDANDLKPLGIDVVQHLPGVGANLQDHLDLYVQYECTQPVTLYHASWRFPHNMAYIGLQWLLTQSGWGASAHLEAGGFVRSRAGIQHPDIQYHFLPGALTGQLNPGKCHAFQAHCSPMRPTSRGFIKLRSTDPRVHPIIQPNYLTTQDDVDDMVAGIKLTREIFMQKAFDPFRGKAISPGPEIQTDADIERWMKQHTESAYHPCCTAKMGTDEMAVVDAETRVRGVEGLRVVDSSIMPSMVSGNLNAPTIMMAEKAADIILGRPPLPQERPEIWVHPEWQSQQR